MDYSSRTEYLRSFSAVFSKTYEVDECAICLESMEAPVGQVPATCRLFCGHTFHMHCMLKVKTCPTCRAEVKQFFPVCALCTSSVTPSQSMATMACCSKVVHFVCLKEKLDQGDTSCRVCFAVDPPSEDDEDDSDDELPPLDPFWDELVIYNAAYDGNLPLPSPESPAEYVEVVEFNDIMEFDENGIEIITICDDDD